MIRTQITLVDFMDCTPVEGATVETTLTVLPVLRIRPSDFDEHDFPVGDMEAPRGPLHSEDPPHRIPQRIRESINLNQVRILYNQAERFTQNGVSDSQGRVISRFDVSGTFDRLRGRQSVDVVAFTQVRVTVGDLDRTFIYNKGLKQGTGPDLLSANDSLEREICLDFGKSIVGHTTQQSARLWFNLNGTIKPDQRYVLEVLEQGSGAENIVSTIVLPVDTARDNTAIVTVQGLQPDTTYRYRAMRRSPQNLNMPGAGRQVIHGTFRTEAVSKDELSFVFASCHKPTHQDSLKRWEALTGRDDYDLMLLMGDQLYADDVDKAFGHLRWSERFRAAYNRFWVYQPMREVMRRTPMYMILDDHEIIDDWGGVEVNQERLKAGLEAYRLYQQVHGPNGLSNQEKMHYHFYRGPAAFFMLDVRTHRSLKPESVASPILGKDQLLDLYNWTQDARTRACDVIFVVAPVPIAYLPVEELRHLIKDFQGEAPCSAPCSAPWPAASSAGLAGR